MKPNPKTCGLAGVRCWGRIAPLLILLPWLAACAGTGSGVRAGAAAQPPPHALLDAPLRDAGQAARPPMPRGEPLARVLARICATGGAELLPLMVADLAAAEVSPDDAFQALVEAGCGSPEAVVEELVAQQGEAAAALITARAAGTSGGDADLAAAVAAGLARAGESGTGGPLADAIDQEGYGIEQDGYGMLYYSSQDPALGADTAVALNRLYQEAAPGFGIYTFVLSGRGGGGATPVEVELLRMIETYVRADASPPERPRSQAHVFLIPVRAAPRQVPLGERLALDLAERMRRELASALREGGWDTWALRLERGQGPFLVAGLTPRLVPLSGGEPRLLTDLSGLGPERVYGIVDAFDRPIPAEVSGARPSLELIRQRLLKTPSAAEDGRLSRGESPWLILLGQSGVVPRPRHDLGWSGVWSMDPARVAIRQWTPLATKHAGLFAVEPVRPLAAASV